MLSIAFQIVELASFIALMVAIWRASKWPRWQIRAVIYGWAASFFWSLFWCFLMPALFSRLGFHLPAETFPDGTIAAAALFGGWFWPLIMVSISGYRDRKKT